MMAEPSVSSGQTSQLIRGHPADVIGAEGRWLRVRGADGYDGWCHEGYLRDDPAPMGLPLHSAWGSERRISLGCTVTIDGGGVVPLPLGALLEPDETVVGGAAMNHRARARYFPQDGPVLARRVVELFRGTPYQWGGVSQWGADCSGVVQTAYALHGTQLPRDAWQQAERGREVPGDLAELAAGDLLFFSDRTDGRPTHVGMSLGGSALAHSSLSNGGFAVDDLAAEYRVAEELRRTFRFARRIW